MLQLQWSSTVELLKMVNIIVRIMVGVPLRATTNNELVNAKIMMMSDDNESMMVYGTSQG